ncbi:transcriptional regulator [Carbonactinospora thermoautotrophica]|uniref:Transcriptional regulator n=1 Tax=Carbonactinospora thermoautotrophica TaxID=1469144 RepID=A0A132MQN8_9ACTN|nr:transcriptional regulator [Carbonactinospora thermoautotrophica]KWX00040.1 transcriptional regulator [Carbonactinospora thermoautotrophica]KWX00201.1 transcriptional regulator [Carbonactinospora thermoautotrophica]KWX03418.1 transcriptional regulator [Carbonactinospora thermoautotrophica]KWX03420.1 transcriptional regulator [Carbonactinospora thermoautotrophica]
MFVRPLAMAEGRRLQRICRTARDPVRLRRAMVVLASAQGWPVPQIARLAQTSQRYVRGVIHDFNEVGFAALDPKWSGGRPRTISEAARAEICLIARCCPRDVGLPFGAWSLSKLREYLIDRGVVASISRETIRIILRGAGISWQATKTWKASTDPDFASKMRRVLALYDHPPEGGRVVCVDEFGPLNLRPRPGRGWYPAGRPARIRATYTRTLGVRHMLAALDLATGKIFYRIRDRKRWREFLAFLKVLRRRWPTERLYVVVDNFAPHRHPKVREWAVDHDVELVFLPTYASWLNWIEPEFTGVRYFALNGSDFTSHDQQNAAIAAYLRWRNQHAEPKRDFAVSSKIRQPDYVINVA